MNRPLLMLALLCLLSCSKSGSSGNNGPYAGKNVILITLDTVRADRLSCYGYDRETTPNLDKLATESVRFTKAHSQSSFTPPSHASLMTSRYPTSHGLLFWTKKLPKEVETIAENLKADGYDTASFSPLAMGTGNGLNQGFDHVTEIGMHWTQVDEETKYHVAPAPVVLERFYTWLDEQRGARSDNAFFSWIHLYDAHRPYSVFAPDREFCRVKDGKLGNHTSLDYQLDEATRTRRNIGKPQAQYIKNRYDSGLLGLDREVGKLFDRLRADGVLDETILIVTSDHGEAFDEFDVWFTHDHYLFDVVTHVPLFIRFPDGRFAGQTVESFAQLIDVVPTLLDYLGGDMQLMQGNSLRPAIEDGREVNEIIAAERQMRDIDDEKKPLPIDQIDFDRSLRSRSSRLLFERRYQRFSLYDRDAEETEQTDTFDESDPTTEALLRRYEKFFENIENLKPDLVLKDLSEEDLKRLKELGYL